MAGSTLTPPACGVGAAFLEFRFAAGRSTRCHCGALSLAHRHAAGSSAAESLAGRLRIAIHPRLHLLSTIALPTSQGALVTAPSYQTLDKWFDVAGAILSAVRFFLAACAMLSRAELLLLGCAGDAVSDSQIQDAGQVARVLWWANRRKTGTVTWLCLSGRGYAPEREMGETRGKPSITSTPRPR